MPKSYGSSVNTSHSEQMPQKITNEPNLSIKLANLYDILIQPSHTTTSISKVCVDIKKLLDAQTEISQLVVDQFIKALCAIKKNTGYYGYANNTNLFSTDILTTVKLLFSQENIIINDDIVIDIINANMADIMESILMGTSKCLNAVQTKHLVNTKIYSTDFKTGNITNKWATLIVNYPDSFTYSSEILLIACNKKILNIISTCINKKINITQECFYGIIAMNDIQLVKLAILSGAKYDDMTLEHACKTQNLELIKLILSNKIKPTKKCFDAIITSENKSYNQKVINNTKSDLVTLLVSFGYKVTYDDIIFATQRHVELTNFKSFGIKLDEKFIETCAQYGFYPYENCGIKSNIKCLQLECNKSGNLTVIKKLVASGLKPDITCLENASKFKNNIQAIKFITEKGQLKPNLQCLYNCSVANYNKTMSHIVEEFIIGSSSVKELENIKKKQTKVYDADNKNILDNENIDENIDINDDDMSVDLIDYGEDELKPEPDVEEKKLEPVVVEEKKPTKKTTKKTELVVEEKKPTKKSTKVVVEVKSDDELEIELVEKKPNKEKKTTKKKLVKEQEPEKIQVPKQEQVPQIHLESIETIIIPPNYDYRADKKINKNIQKTFGLEKYDLISFINLRKYVMTYVNNNKLIKDNILQLDTQLKMLTNNKYETVDLKYMDKLIYLMLLEI